MKPDRILEIIRSGGSQFLRILWCDNGNVIRAKALYLPAFFAHFADAEDSVLLAALENAISVTAAMQSVPATRDVPAPEAGLAPVQDVRLVPAWETLAAANVPAGELAVIGEFYAGESVWAHCPRSFLRRMVERLAAHDLELHVGLELEYYLLIPEDPPRPIDRTVYAQGTAALTSGQVVAEIAGALWGQGIPVEQVIAEGGPGQQEMSLEHCGPLVLADRLVHARQTIHRVAMEHELAASFLPVVFEDAAGSGLHTHMSLRWDGQNVTPDEDQPWGLSAEANAFMAGILTHLPALMAVTTPTKNSFRRIRPHVWSGAYQAWGIANKEAALRAIADPLSGELTNVELKTVDATANPYLALGCIIACGIDGLEHAWRLPTAIDVDPGDYSTGEREKRGIRPLPTVAETALTNFANNPIFAAAMGENMAAVFSAVRRAELQSLADYSFAAERDLLLQRY